MLKRVGAQRAGVVAVGCEGTTKRSRKKKEGSVPPATAPG